MVKLITIFILATQLCLANNYEAVISHNTSGKVWKGYFKTSKEAQDWVNEQRLDVGKSNTETSFSINDKTADISLNKDLMKRLKLMDCGKRIIAIMSVINKGKTKDQRKQILINFKSIKTQLDAGSIDLAKDSIMSITPDGVLVTQSTKDAILTELDSCLGI